MTDADKIAAIRTVLETLESIPYAQYLAAEQHAKNRAAMDALWDGLAAEQPAASPTPGAPTMTDDKQPTTNDYRKRIARPLYVQTFGNTAFYIADNEANAYSDKVTDRGGEVIDIRPYVENDSTGDYPAVYHYRVVTYRAPSRIAP